MVEDIHKIWKLWGAGGLIDKIGPHRTIRELKKRCEAGAVIGCSLYKLLIEKWMDTAMNMVDPGARGPAYEFIEAAGEGELIPKIEALHEKYPPKRTLIKEKEELVTGIPVDIRFDLKDEWNAQLEKKVGRRIPLDPRDASKKDIEESKKVVELLAAGEGLPRPLKPKLEKEELPLPVKPAERPPPRAAIPEVPPTPITVKAVLEYELMKKEIEERIEEEKRRRLKRGPIAGESSEEYLMKGAGKKTSFYSGWTYDYFKVIINRTFDIEELMDLAKHIEESTVMTPGDKVSVRQLVEKRKRDIISGTPELRKQIEEQQREDQLATASKLRDGDEEKIKEQKRRQLRGGGMAGESGDDYLGEPSGKKISDLPLEERLKTARAIAAGAAGPVKPAAVSVCPEIPGFTYCPTCKFKYSVSDILSCPYRPEPTRLFREEGGVSKSFTEFIKWVEKVKDMGDLDQLKKLYNEVDTIPVLSSYDKLQLQKFIMTRMQDILELQEKGKPQFPEQFMENNKDKSEDVIHEPPEDYKLWTFADFEPFIYNEDDTDELLQLHGRINISSRLTETEKTELHELIDKQIREIEGGS